METSLGDLIWYVFMPWAMFFIAGYLTRQIKQDRQMDKLYWQAIRRGNYWHDKYMSLADEDWRPMYDESYLDGEDDA